MRNRSGPEASSLELGVAEDSRLVLLSRQGDRGAFGALVRKYAGVVRALVRARVGSEADADDAAQEVFLQAYRRLDALQDPERFAGWISRIAVNKALEQRRRGGRHAHASLSAVPSEPPAAAGEDVLEVRDEVERMLGHVATLDEKSQTILVLRFREGLAVKDIAARLGDQPPAVSMRITRALRRLRTLLEGEAS